MKRFTRVLTAAAVLLLSGGAMAQTKIWTTTPDFNVGTLVNASDTKFANELVLGPTAVSQTHTVWTDNFNYGLILRLSSLTGAQTSRVDTVLNTINGVSTGVRPANEFCNWANTGNCPEGITVDANGDAWILNNAYGNQGSITKIAGNVAHCIDRNNNGKIDTSSDLNNDGIIDMNPAHGEYLGQNDECILTTLAVGANNAWPRAIAVDERGKIWVGTFNEGKVYRYNPEAPYALELTVTVGGNPFAMAGGGSYVFVANASGQTARVQIQTGAVDYAPCPGNYGITADPGGQVAWLGTWFNQATGMYRADFGVHTCTLMSGGPGATTGMTLDNEPAAAGGPYVWGANYSQEKVSKWTPAGVYTGSVMGLSLDFQGNLWTLSNLANNQKELSQLNPATGALNFSAFVGYLAADQATYPTNCSTGYCDGATPFLYNSDFTGVQIDRMAPYGYLGTFDAVYDGGAHGIPWSKVVWNTEPQGAVPAETSLQVNVRSADSLAALATTTFTTAISGAALAGIVGEFIEIEASLSGPGFVTPVLSDVSVIGPCAVIGNACCLQNTDCNDGVGCDVGTCSKPGGTCSFKPANGCCMVNADCNDGNACTTDACPMPGGQCTSTPIAGCCNTAADCSDTDACTLDTCSGPGGTCSHPLIPGCCLTDVDCTHGSACVTSTCPMAGAQCVTVAHPSCCASDADCADTNACTADTCAIATGVCSNTTIAGCCNVDGDCNDSNACTKDTCSGPGGVCVFSPIASCCMTPADCPASTACSQYSCSGTGGVCVEDTTPSCCATVADCDDGNLCTTDTCPSPGGACAHAPIAACCTTSAECDDGNRCTEDDCPTAGGMCTHAPLTGCCTTSSDCTPGAACVGGWCAVAGVDGGSAPARDGGRDAARESSDGGAHVADAGVVDTVASSGGCGCAVPGAGRRGDLGGLLGLVGLTLLGARRRRRADSGEESRVADGTRRAS